MKSYKHHSCLQKSYFFEETKPAELRHTEVRIGDAPKSQFPLETHHKIQSSGFGGRRQRRQPVNIDQNRYADRLLYLD